MFAVAYTTTALKARKRLPRNLRERITAKIEEAAANPTEHSQVKSLVGTDAYRLRIGDWRVLFELDHGPNKMLLVLDIRHRREAYR